MENEQPSKEPTIEKPGIPTEPPIVPPGKGRSFLAEYALPLAIVFTGIIISGSILYGVAVSGGLPFAKSTADVNPPSQNTAGTTAGTVVSNDKIVAADSESLGDAQAKVTVVEFADFQCPFCSKFFTDVEPTIIKDYVNTGKVRFIFRNFAFLGPDSSTAGEAAYCAGDQGKFWQYHDYLYGHQGAENSGAFSAANLEGFAKTMGLNTDQFNQCLSSQKYAARVAADTAAGKAASVNGTPTVFVNGTPLVGALPLDQFKQAIDAALSK